MPIPRQYFIFASVNHRRKRPPSQFKIVSDRELFISHNVKHFSARPQYEILIQDANDASESES